MFGVILALKKSQFGRNQGPPRRYNVWGAWVTDTVIEIEHGHGFDTGHSIQRSNDRQTWNTPHIDIAFQQLNR